MTTITLIQGIRIFVASLLALALSMHGYKRKSLDTSGAAAAFIVGFISLGSSYRFGSLLLLFYYSSSKLTKLKEDIKAKYEDDYAVGGQRNWIQVFANSILAVGLCLYHILAIGEDSNLFFASSTPDFLSHLSSQISCMIVAHYACANGDTWASEVGILSQTKPRLVTTLFLKEVPPGTNGGMSLLGTAASGLGGGFIGLIYLLFSAITMLSDPYASSNIKQQLLMIPFGVVCGLVGSLIDSVLGGTVQASYYCQRKRKIVKHFVKDPSVSNLGGFDLLSNEAVNFLSIALTMGFSWFVAPIFFTAI